MNSNTQSAIAAAFAAADKAGIRDQVENPVRVSPAEFFLAVAVDIETPIIGRKEAERQGCRTTAEQILEIIPFVRDFVIPEPFAAKVSQLKDYFQAMNPKNEFEQNVVQHTLDSLRLGTVNPRSAAFVAWAGKVWKDRLAVAAAEQEAAQAAESMSAGDKMTLQATFQGCRVLHTSYGVNCVHSFLADDGKVLEWWTDRSHGYDSATNPDAPKEGDRVTLTCKFKKPSVFRGKVTYRVTHAKFKAI